MYKYVLPLIAIIVMLYSCNNKKSEKVAEEGKDTINIISDNTSMYLLAGTYTTGGSEGIYVYQFDTISGHSEYISMVKVTNPSYLTVSKDEKYVYSVSETADGTASANAFSFNKGNGELTLLNTQLTQGADPCYITVDDLGKHVVTANYSGGSITVFDVKNDGSLATASQVIPFSGKGADADRQQKPHLHCVQYSPDQKYLFADDLGTDKIHKFNVNDSGNYLQAGTPTAFKVADASGPRHLEFHPNGRNAYLINELSGAVTVFSYDASKGDLKEIQSVKADTLNAKGSADIHITPDGKFLYASNRLKGDGLAIFSVEEDGKLTKVGYQVTGLHPRNFVITPNGKFLLVACRDENIIQIFAIDKNTGMLKNIHKDIKLDMPVCLKFVSFQ